ENLLKEAGFAPGSLEKLEFLASSHILANPTAQASKVVFAGAGFAEKRGTYVNVTGRLQRANQAILPPGEAREDWETLGAILAGLNKDFTQPAGLDSVLNQLCDEVPAFSGQSWGRIGDQGVVISETGEKIPLIEQEKARVAQGQIVG
ncbi:MAG: molybdopterin-dependent oxidoreductase, partial [Verrucomicrobiales bacterium]